MSKNFQEFFLFMDTWARNYGYMSKKFFCSCWYGRRRKKTYIPWEGGGLVRGQGHNLVISARCALFPTPSHNRCHLSNICLFSIPHEQVGLYHMSKLVFFYTTCAIPHEQECCSCSFLMGAAEPKRRYGGLKPLKAPQILTFYDNFLAIVWVKE